MKLLKQRQFWLSLVIAMLLFALTYPFYHDMYIGTLHTVICICLNGFSSILFSTFLYCKWSKQIHAGNRIIFLVYTLMQALGHGIFVIMNWGSILFLLLSALLLIQLLVSHFHEKRS